MTPTLRRGSSAQSETVTVSEKNKNKPKKPRSGARNHGKGGAQGEVTTLLVEK